MADNRDTSAARTFHAATKYVPIPPAEGTLPIGLGTPPDIEYAVWEKDWSLEPFPFKVYRSLPPIPLPREFGAAAISGLTALTGESAASEETTPDRSLLARIALHTNGLLNRAVPRRDGTTHQFRTAGGTGARYHLELYFASAELSDLEAGIYHYDARDHCLRQLRAGDFRRALVDATGGEGAVADAPVVLAMTSTFWRNAWRYKARAYRHAYWDAGTSMSHVLAVSASVGLSARVVMGYADEPVNALLDVDGEREATVALCALGHGSPATETPPELSALSLATLPISPREVSFPEIPAMHHASELESGTKTRGWRSTRWPAHNVEPTGPVVRLEPLDSEHVSGATAEELIFRRRSTRNYDEQPTSFAAFSTLLQVSAGGFDADTPHTLHQLYLIVNRVEGLTPGLYVHHPSMNAVELLREGDFRADAQRLAVGQDYTARAHVNCYYLTDLEPALERFGNRGYRAAQLECSLHAGRLHLAAHALGCGAVGSTSYDDEVIDLFSPHAAGKSYMFVTVFGKRRPRRS